MPSNPQPECPLAHNLINKLSTVIGYCDLMLDKAPPDSPLLSTCARFRVSRSRWRPTLLSSSANW